MIYRLRDMKTKRLLILLVLLLMAACPLFSQGTGGTDFWMAFMPNFEEPDHPVTLNLIVTAKQASIGTVTNPRTGWTTSFTVEAASATTINIPREEAYFEFESDCILDNVFHIECKDTIMLYASNFRDYSFDAFNVLPAHLLGSDYILQVYPPNSGTGHEGLSSEFSVVALEDGTTVEIDLACDSHNGHLAHEPFTVALDAGQSYQVQSSIYSDGELTGTRIAAIDGKPIAVFGGDRVCHIPWHYDEAMDAIYEQMLPIDYWGTQFVATPTMLRSVDRVKITALNDNCQVFIDGALQATIGAAETFEFEIRENHPMTSAYFIETSEPALVYLYIPSAGYENYSGAYYGDPAMVMLAPLESTIRQATFPSFIESSHCSMVYINIVAETQGVAGMILDGQSIASSFMPVPGNPNYSFARMGLNSAAHHTLLNAEGGFLAYTYGLGTCESYAFSLGGNFEYHPVCVPENKAITTMAFPNPVNSLLTIEGHGITAIRIIDAMGLEMKKILCSPAESVILDVSDLPQGIYFAEISATIGKSVKRLVVAR